MSDDESFSKNHKNTLPTMKKRASSRKKKIGKANKFFDLKNFKDKIMSDLL